MRAVLTSILTVAAFLAARPAGARSATRAVETHVLQSGVTLVVAEDRSSPLVAAVALYKAGTRDHPRDRPGLAHLLEHVLIDASPGVRPSVDRLHLHHHGVTTLDHTYYESEVPRELLEVVFWREAQRLIAFEDSWRIARALPGARHSVRNEEHERDDRVADRSVDQALKAALYGADHPYAHAASSQRASWAEATMPDLKSFHDLHYRANNLVIALVGGVTGQQAVEVAERFFARIPRRPGGARQAAPALPRGERFLRLPSAGAKQLHVSYGVIGRFAPGDAELALLPALLGGRRGWLWRRLVDERRVAKSVMVDHRAAELAGSLDIRITPADGVSVADVLSELDRAVAELRTGGPEPKDLDRARARVQAARASLFERRRTTALALATAAAATGRANAHWLLHGRQLTAPLADLRAAVAAHLRPDNRLIVEVGTAGGRPADRATAVAARGGLDEEWADRPRPAGPPARGMTFPMDPKSTYVPVPYIPAVNSVSTLPEPHIETFVLTNGLRVFVAPRRGVGTVEASLVIDAGERRSPAALAGLAAATASVVTSAASPRGQQRDDDIEALAAGLGASAAWTTASVWLTTVSDRLDAALPVWADAIRAPDFASVALDRWRRMRLTLLAKIAQDPKSVSAAGLFPRMYPASSRYARPPTGTAETLQRLTIGDVQRFYAHHYRPQAAFVVVVGDVEPSHLHARLQDLLGTWTVSDAAPVAAAAVPPRDPPPGTSIALIDVPDAKQASISVAAHGLAGDDIDAARLDLLVSWLDRDARRDLDVAGLSYRASADLTATPEIQLISVDAAVDATRVGPGIAKLNETIDRVRTGRAADLEPFLHDYEIALHRTFETCARLESWLTRQVRVGMDKPPTFAAIHAPFTQLRGEQIRSFANVTLAPSRRVVVVAGDARIVAAALAELGPVTTMPNPLGAPPR